MEKAQTPAEARSFHSREIFRRESFAAKCRIVAPAVLFFASGAAGLVYQVVSTKQVGLLFGYSAYAVADSRAGKGPQNLSAGQAAKRFRPALGKGRPEFMPG
ncbi:MAG TPA: hypothetical protein VN749_02770 [Candidatus Eisenbacteria bacterium]|nr:hypothetical protein [Candidatus Eisenbacteria bacterium]